MGSAPERVRTCRFALRQLEIGGSMRELALPPLDLFQQHAALEPPPMPLTEVGILQRWGQRAPTLALSRAIQRTELLPEDRQRPRVADQVMHRQQQSPRFRLANHRCTKSRRSLQV